MSAAQLVRPLLFASRSVPRQFRGVGKPNLHRIVMASSADASHPAPNTPKKRPHGDRPQHRFKRAKKDLKTRFEGTHEDVLLADVWDLLANTTLEDAKVGASANEKDTEAARAVSSEPKTADAAPSSLPEKWSEIELPITSLSCTGDGLALTRLSDGTPHVYVVPFTLPGDVVVAKVVRHTAAPIPSSSSREMQPIRYTVTDFVRVVAPSPQRDGALVKCKYFAACSGCQLQMLDYGAQLAHKRTVVERAFARFSGLDTKKEVPVVGDTVASPLEYRYRTKLTPHFDGPPGRKQSDGRKGIVRGWGGQVPPIGFMRKGTRQTIDIEECPIGTEAVEKGMRRERDRVARDIEKYKRGATLLCRESTRRVAKYEWEKEKEQRAKSVEVKREWEDEVVEDRGEFVHVKSCVTDSNAETIEYVDDNVFSNTAGAFFQNNNSILPVFTQYIRDNALGPLEASSASNEDGTNLPNPCTNVPSTALFNLIDAYSGSGLFTITLSSLFSHSIGIDISPASIRSANRNAHELNKLSPSRASFQTADAAALFESLPDNVKGDNSAVVIDPPRKGCDEGFLRQLAGFAPRRVVYVSCNVATQARDVGVLVKGIEGEEVGSRYMIESLRGFDFFPQTGHVEGVCVLTRREKGEAESG
ncbi:S-adenosyl-L-methionine-dependent methyltransferase [Lineolata rhizophorae]|uniref:S-adenosyl-L-methionine-dependent methyltransferase n=1 Tax=Lineolata rhizophorae TaxID=578093 RepID=A0A6A6PBA1_9PEZI|nr:S-adenosyl-L-methionine-dependent methyltransferase [Lineolata rhizophorae]